jgi:dihydroorotate dehydrogenase (fumarate)
MDLTTTYLGLQLGNPLVASASPISHTVDGVRRLADAGVAAVVLYSLFEEEIEAEAERYARLAEAGTERFAESLSYFPQLPGADIAPRYYLSLLERARSSLDIPVIGSLNGTTPSGWARYARQMQEAGAAAIELNTYLLAADAATEGRDVEDRLIEIVALVKATVEVPVAVKLSPFWSSPANLARRVAEAGADGLVLFNRFLQPDIDLEGPKVVPGISLSTSTEARLSRTWIALLRRQLHVDLAGTTGVEGPEDLIKYLLAGADVVMTTSALLRHGPEHASVLLAGLRQWMARRGYERLDELRGLLAVPAGVDATAHERASYVAALRAANASSYHLW